MLPRRFCQLTTCAALIAALVAIGSTQPRIVGPEPDEAGIGALVGYRGKNLTIVQVYAGLPAAIVGLGPGDVILRVDGEPVAGRPIEELVAVIRGPIGTTVRLDVRSTGSPETRVLLMTRQPIGWEPPVAP